MKHCIAIALGVWSAAAAFGDELSPSAPAQAKANVQPADEKPAKNARRRGSPEKQKQQKQDDAQGDTESVAKKGAGQAAEQKPAEAQQKPAAEPQAAELLEAFEAVVEEVVGVVGGGDQFEQQFAAQFRMLLKTELHFVRTICQPTAEQDKVIRVAGEVSLKQAVKTFAETQKKLQQGGFRAGQQPQFPDPRTLIAEGLTKSVEATLPADKAQKYRVELEKRAAARKRVGLLNLVARLDKDLVLTADQRQKLTAALSAHWQDAWVQQLELYLYGEQFFPILPDNQVEPILNDKQKQVWRAIPKNQNAIWGWAGMGFIQAVDIDVEEVAAPEDKKKNNAEKTDE